MGTRGDELHDVGELTFRYEDFAQDGRPLLGVLPPSLGSVWRHELEKQPESQALRAAGILPILTRIEIDLSSDSFSPNLSGRVLGRGDLLRAEVPAGEHARVLCDVRTRVVAPTGHALLPHDGSEPREVGTLLGEHVLTRLFAEKDHRRVAPDDLPAVGITLPPARPWQPPQAIVTVEPEATPIAGFQHDPMPQALGLMHTDANQHVNSLVYPHLFEAAVLRRLRALGRDHRVSARSLRIGYRKPSFAGEAISIDLALFERGERLVAVGRFFGEGEADPDRARVYIRLELAP